MIFSIGCEYAIRAMTYLAEFHGPGEFCLLRTIAKDDNLPQHFVGKIFQSLVKAGLLHSAKGRGGGFALKRPADTIKLIDIVQAIDGLDRLNRCAIGNGDCNTDQAFCPLHEQWDEHRQRIEQWLNSSTLASLAQRSAEMRGAAERADVPHTISIAKAQQDASERRVIPTPAAPTLNVAMYRSDE